MPIQNQDTLAQLLRGLPDSDIIKADGKANYDKAFQKVLHIIIPNPSTFQRTLAKEAAARRAKRKK